MSRDSFYIKRIGKQISDIRMIMYLFYLACFPLTVFPSTSIIYLTSGLSRNAPDGKRRIVKDREQQLLSAQGSHATCRPGAKHWRKELVISAAGETTGTLLPRFRIFLSLKPICVPRLYAGRARTKTRPGSHSRHLFLFLNNPYQVFLFD